MHFHASPWRLAGLLALTSMMVGLSLACTRVPGIVPQVFGWFGAAFFGLGFVVLPRRLLARGPLVTIDEVGITDRRLGPDPVRWEEVASLWISAVQGSRFLCVELLDPEAYFAQLAWWPRRLSRMNARLGFGHIAIGFVDLTPGLDAAWDHIGALRKIAAPGPWEDEL